MTTKSLTFTTPVARLVGGSLYDARTEDFDGKPLVVKTGANAGKPRVEYSFGVAIPKNPGETHWAQNPALAPIYHFAAQQFPNGEFQHPQFAWKIQDGDSQIPNKKGKKNADREGFPGHWIIWFSGGQAPRVYNRDGTQIITEPGAVKLGYWVQVFGNVTDNKPSQSPGLYMNHSMVALTAYGDEIVLGPDVSAAGFGQGVALPPGATMTPPATAGAFNPASLPPVPGVPAGLPQIPGMPAAPVAQVPNLPVSPVGSVPTPAAPAPIVAAPAPLPQAPNPAILAVPTPPAAVAPPPVVGRQLTAAANGHTYEQLIANGWTHATLVQHGLMVA